MTRLLAAFGIAVLLGGTALAQGTAPRWSEEFFERPRDWGGDMWSSTLFMPGGQRLRVACTPNRVERVMIVFPRAGSEPAPLAATPQVRYAFDNDDLRSAEWPLFERGSIEVPRGAESARITRRIAETSRFLVQATSADGTWLTAEFELAGSGQLVPKMLASCGVQ